MVSECPAVIHFSECYQYELIIFLYAEQIPT